MISSRLLALDVGNRRIGVAVSDPLRILARPLTTIQRRAAAADVQAVVDLIAEWDVAQLVVGHPLLPSGDRGEQARAVESFVRQLEAAVAVPVILWDESYTTETAAARLRVRGLEARAAKGLIDAEAAVVILEEWMRAEGETPGAADAAREAAGGDDAPREAAGGDDAPREAAGGDDAPREAARTADAIE